MQSAERVEGVKVASPAAEPSETVIVELAAASQSFSLALLDAEKPVAPVAIAIVLFVQPLASV